MRILSLILRGTRYDCFPRVFGIPDYRLNFFVLCKFEDCLMQKKLINTLRFKGFLATSQSCMYLSYDIRHSEDRHCLVII